MSLKNYTTSRMVYLLVVCVAVSSIFISCKSKIESELAEEENPKIIIMRIRELTLSQRYKLAEQQYVALKQRFPDDAALQIEIDYEIAFISVRRKKYKQAKPLFEAILRQYETDANSDQLPEWPYYLSQKLLNDIIIPKLNKPSFWSFLTPKKKRQEQEQNEETQDEEVPVDENQDDTQPSE